MGQRTLKRVPMDFDWPLNEVWVGYLLPTKLRLPDCVECRQTGYSREALPIADGFYAFEAPRGSDLKWSDRLVQADIDVLLAENRLFDLTRGGHVPTPDEVNAWERGGLGHDAINRMILVRSRCERLGIPLHCAICNGNGDIGTDEQRKAIDEWEPVEPPPGDGYQLWETTSEGSPISPVFATPEELARWAAANATAFGSMTLTEHQWLAAFTSDSKHAVDHATTLVATAPRRDAEDRSAEGMS